MLELIKKRCGIAAAIAIYDEDIKAYIEDCTDDMIISGVDKAVIKAQKQGIITAITLYVKANLGNDRSDTEKYMELYRKKVFRLTFQETEGQQEGGTDVEQLD